MATTMTREQIRTDARTRANQQQGGVWSDDEWNTNINASLFALYGLLITSYGEDYFVKLPTYTFTTDGTSDRFALPTDFFKLLGVDVLVGSKYRALRKFNFNERNRFTAPAVTIAARGISLRYRLLAGYLWLAPRAASGQTIQVWYVPRMTTLDEDDDTFDGIDGWLDWVVADVARKAMLAEETDTAPIERELEGLRARIVSEAPNRDANEPGRVTDVYASEYDPEEI